jgi:hypothetical protein
MRYCSWQNKNYITGKFECSHPSHHHDCEVEGMNYFYTYCADNTKIEAKIGDKVRIIGDHYMYNMKGEIVKNDIKLKDYKVKFNEGELYHSFNGDEIDIIGE